ncbi:MAG: T9SS type A sorting domain-containing protein [Bacteroidota bacterium]
MHQIHRSLCFLLLLTSSSLAVAQTPSGDTELTCGESGVLIVRDFGTRFCFDTTQAVAERLFRGALRGMVSCRNDCLSPGLYDCQLELGEFYEGKLTRRNGQYCPSSSRISIGWTCTDCTRTTSTGAGSGNSTATGTELACEESGRYKLASVGRHNFPRSRFATREAAAAQLAADILAQLQCRNTCMDPTRFDCEPQLSESVLRYISSSSTAFYVPNATNLTARWACTECLRKPPGGGTTGGGSTTTGEDGRITGSSTSCSKSTQFVARDLPRHCYKHLFPEGDLEAAQALFRSDLLAMLHCEVDCERPNETCTPLITSGSINGNLGADFCSGRYIAFNWKCTDCTETSDTPPNEGEGEGRAPQPGSEWSRSQVATTASPVRVGKATPNPSSGEVRLDISVEVPRQALVLRISDVQGRVIAQHAYGDLPAGTQQLTADLSAQRAGLYFLSLYANGQLVNSQKILVQH